MSEAGEFTMSVTNGNSPVPPTWLDRAYECFNLAPSIPSAKLHWKVPTDDEPPHLLLLQIYAAKGTPLMAGTYDLSTAEGFSIFMIEKLKVVPKSVVQAIPGARAYVVELDDDTELRELPSDTMALGPNLGFQFFALDPHLLGKFYFTIHRLIGDFKDADIIAAVKALSPLITQVTHLVRQVDTNDVYHGQHQGLLYWQRRHQGPAPVDDHLPRAVLLSPTVEPRLPRMWSREPHQGEVQRHGARPQGHHYGHLPPLAPT